MALTKKQKQVLDFIFHYSNTHGYAPTQTEIQEHFSFKSLGSVQKYLKYLSNDGYINLEPNARRGIEILPPAQKLYAMTSQNNYSELSNVEELPNTFSDQNQSIHQLPSNSLTNSRMEFSDNGPAGSPSPNDLANVNRLREIPLMGNVAAGLPIEGVKHFEFVDVPESFLKQQQQYFALSVQGESMIEDGIHDGDTIVVEQKNTANRGETIVAMVGNEATVKKYHPFKDRIELHPANSTMEPIIIKNESKGEFRIVGKLAALLRSYS